MDEMNKMSDIHRLVRIFVNCGITKIRLTGGEPTIHPMFDHYADLLKSFPQVDRAITTNGVMIKKIEKIISSFNRVNVSLDTLESEKFQLISNRPPNVFQNIIKFIDTLSLPEHCEKVKEIKINTVVMRGINDDELLKIIFFANKFNNRSKIVVRFIELMPFNGNGHANKLFVNKDEILKMIQSQNSGLPIDVKSFSSNSSAGQSLYSLPSGESFGIISSITDNFCGSCNRLRLTSDGKLRNCLFSDIDTETDLMKMIRDGYSDDEIEIAIRKNIGNKFFSHGGKSVDELIGSSYKNRSMISLGG